MISREIWGESQVPDYLMQGNPWLSHILPQRLYHQMKTQAGRYPKPLSVWRLISTPCKAITGVCRNKWIRYTGYSWWTALCTFFCTNHLTHLNFETYVLLIILTLKKVSYISWMTHWGNVFETSSTFFDFLKSFDKQLKRSINSTIYEINSSYFVWIIIINS